MKLLNCGKPAKTLAGASLGGHSAILVGVLTCFLAAMTILSASIARAQDPASSVDQLAKDFAIACEMSKLSIALGKTAAFKEDKADLAYRVSELMSGAFKTHEVKDTYKAITQAAPESRVELWHKSAKDLGVKKFNCKTIGFK